MLPEVIGFRVSQHHTLFQVDPAGVIGPDLRPSSYPPSVPLGKDRATQSAAPELLCRDWEGPFWPVEGPGSVG